MASNPQPQPSKTKAPKTSTPPPPPEKRTERRGTEPDQMPDRNGPQHLPEGDREYQFDTTPRDAQAAGEGDDGREAPSDDRPRGQREDDRGISMSREHRSSDRNPKGADPQQTQTLAQNPGGRLTR